ncbi:MAG TPA: TetR/AcrR family transcriptional regulator [Anaerolineaceae bacterium]|nr:TetR/AcrR family transcriptional regulator [Anaerolineaceae bacterium]
MVRTPSPKKRETFLNSALRLFVARGAQNTSTAEIAKAAGTAAGTLFLYFPTKQDLIDELVLKIGKEQSEYIKSLLSPALPVRETFFTIWEGSLRWFLDNPDAYQFNQQIRDTNLVSEAVVQRSALFLDYYFITVQRGLEAGLIKPYPIEMIGGLLYQNLVGMMNLLRAQPDAEQQAALIRMGFDIFWDGIKSQKQ